MRQIWAYYGYKINQNVKWQRSSLNIGNDEIKKAVVYYRMVA